MPLCSLRCLLFKFRAEIFCSGDYAAVGMLTIVSLRDLRTYGRESRWLPIEERNKELDL